MYKRETGKCDVAHPHALQNGLTWKNVYSAVRGESRLQSHTHSMSPFCLYREIYVIIYRHLRLCLDPQCPGIYTLGEGIERPSKNIGILSTGVSASKEISLKKFFLNIDIFY